jgi:hypothetical protein
MVVLFCITYMLDAQIFIEPQRVPPREHIQHRNCYRMSRRMQAYYGNATVLGTEKSNTL